MISKMYIWPGKSAPKKSFAQKTDFFEDLIYMTE
jgi:hypothetical protein